MTSDVPDELSRRVYCVLGIPLDALSMEGVLRYIRMTAASRAACLISTPNINFLVNSRVDAEFRETLLDSDLCPVDGTPLVWIARLLGAPITTRVAGSDIFDALKSPDRGTKCLTVFFFGGEPGAAAAVARALNDAHVGLRCVGTFDPGFGPFEEMSSDEIIEKVNASDADILIVALGARKGQLWLHRNHHRLKIPVRAHLGAVMNFQAGTIKRAPIAVRSWGLEWLWRIKEEPYLWRRYWHDGAVLLYVLTSRVIPLVVTGLSHSFLAARSPRELAISRKDGPDRTTIHLSGDATEQNIAKATAEFQNVVGRENKGIYIDMSKVRFMDARFLGLLLMLRKALKRRDKVLKIVGASTAIKRTFYLNELNFLLSSD